MKTEEEQMTIQEEIIEEIEKVRKINNDLKPEDIDFDNYEDRRDFIEDIKKELEANLQIGRQEAQKLFIEAVEKTKVRKKQRYIHQTWAFRRLQNMIQYKALWNNLPMVYIQPQYTSQVCPKCLSTNKRVKSNYKCKFCGSEYNSDLVGAINITKKFWEGISFPEMASINNAIGFSFSEPQAMNIGRAKKSILKGGCFSSQA